MQQIIAPINPYDPNCKMEYTDIESKTILSPVVVYGNVSLIIPSSNAQAWLFNVTVENIFILKSNQEFSVPNGGLIVSGPFATIDKITYRSCFGSVTQLGMYIFFLNTTSKPIVTTSLFQPEIFDPINLKKVNDIILTASYPQFIEEITDETLPESSVLDKSCVISSKPEAVMVWKKNGIPMSEDQTKRLLLVMSSSSYSIKLNDLKLSDQGYYECVAKNALGEAKKGFYLKVLPPNPIVPVIPINPVNPVNPVVPVNPNTPVITNAPIDSKVPINPQPPNVNPIIPVDPNVPVDPIVPVDPKSPIVPPPDKNDNKDKETAIVPPTVFPCDKDLKSQCLNGGTCYQILTNPLDKFCRCTTDYMGKYCEKKSLFVPLTAGDSKDQVKCFSLPFFLFGIVLLLIVLGILIIIAICCWRCRKDGKSKNPKPKEPILKSNKAIQYVDFSSSITVPRIVQPKDQDDNGSILSHNTNNNNNTNNNTPLINRSRTLPPANAAGYYNQSPQQQNLVNQNNFQQPPMWPTAMVVDNTFRRGGSIAELVPLTYNPRQGPYTDNGSINNVQPRSATSTLAYNPSIGGGGGPQNKQRPSLSPVMNGPPTLTLSRSPPPPPVEESHEKLLHEIQKGY